MLFSPHFTPKNTISVNEFSLMEADKSQFGLCSVERRGSENTLLRVFTTNRFNRWYRWAGAFSSRKEPVGGLNEGFLARILSLMDSHEYHGN